MSKFYHFLPLSRVTAIPTISFIICIVAIGSLPALLSHCSSATDSAPPIENSPRLVGTITKVFPSHHYVLIKAQAPNLIPVKDTVLLAQDNNAQRLSNLIVTGEKLPTSPHFPADIRSGKPLLGDKVYIYESLADKGKGVVVVTPPTGSSPAVKSGEMPSEEIRFPALDNPKEFSSKLNLDEILAEDAESSQ